MERFFVNLKHFQNLYQCFFLIRFWFAPFKGFFFVLCVFYACPQTASTHGLLSILHVLLLQVSSTAFPFYFLFYFILLIISVIAIFVYFYLLLELLTYAFYSSKKAGGTAWYLVYQHPSGWHGLCQWIYPTPHGDRCFTVSTQYFLHYSPWIQIIYSSMHISVHFHTLNVAH